MKKTDWQKVPFDKICVAAGLPCPVAEYRFAPPRRWKFDWAFPDLLIAVEREGGIFVQGRHSRGAGMLGDMEKYNEAAIRGWMVLRRVPRELNNGDTMDLIRRAIAARKEAA